MLNSTQIPQTPPAVLPDDSDRASFLVGYDINNYVFGNNTLQQTTQTAPADGKTETKIKAGGNKTNALLAVLALGALGVCTYFGLSKSETLDLPKLNKLFKKSGGLLKKININA